MCGGVALSGLPMPRSMMSSPATRAFALAVLTSAKTYGGRRRMRWNSPDGSLPMVGPFGSSGLLYQTHARAATAGLGADAHRARRHSVAGQRVRHRLSA